SAGEPTAVAAAFDEVDPDALVDAAESAAMAADAATAEGQQFATVGESFQLLLGKAKAARSARRDDRASGE
ncbi:MAG: hypothetical protein JWN41_1278, partial [Thermoleophilia bacterium]|nr:hypothetical protein [Thermoleophilia bacterium]